MLTRVASAGIERLKERLGLNTETKYLFDSAGGTLGTAFGTILSLPVIPQGSTGITRNGASLRVVRQRLRWVFNTAATGTAACLVRLFILYKDMAVGNTATPASAYLNDPTTWLSPQAYGYLASLDGVKCLFDKTYRITTLAADAPMVQDELVVELPEQEMEYTTADTTGAIGDLKRGDFEIYAAYGGNVAAITTAPTFGIQRVTEFVDN